MHLLLHLNKIKISRARLLVKQQPFYVYLNFFGIKTLIATNSHYFTEHIRLGYGHFETPSTENNDVTILALESGQDNFKSSFNFLLPEREVQDNVVMSLEGNLIFLLRGRSITAYYITMNLFGEIIMRLRYRFVCLHAASVSFKKNAVILCGMARCGKTSLTTNLISRGFEYSSDDVTLMDRRNLKIAAFPRAINVREETHELPDTLLNGARRIGFFQIADQKRLIVDLGRKVPESVQPRIICFPQYRAGQPTVLHPLEKAEALIELMQNRFHPIGDLLNSKIHEDFNILSRLVEQCVCYKLYFTDITVACKLISELLIEN